MSTHQDSNQNKCKGCLINQSRARKFCYFRNIKRVEDCPCGECLVKMVCIEQTVCEPRRKAMEKNSRKAYSITGEQLKKDFWI